MIVYEIENSDTDEHDVIGFDDSGDEVFRESCDSFNEAYFLCKKLNSL